MKQVIRKYSLEIEPVQKFNLPKGYEIVHFGVIKGEVFFWARINPDGLNIPVEFYAYKDEDSIKFWQFKDYVGTYRLRDGTAVHVLKRENPPR